MPDDRPGTIDEMWAALDRIEMNVLTTAPGAALDARFRQQVNESFLAPARANLQLTERVAELRRDLDDLRRGYSEEG